MVNLITTLGGWTLVAVVGYTYWWRFKNEKARRRGPPSKGEREQAVAAREKRRGNDKAEHVAEVDIASASPKLKSRKKDKPKPAPSSGSSAVQLGPSVVEPASGSRSAHKEADDVAFAKQLASTQQGTSLKAPDTQGAKVRTNKIRTLKADRSQESLRDADKWHSSGPSSSAGADEEDSNDEETDGPAQTQGSVDANAHGISDMLEAPAPGPKALRLVPSDKPQRQSAPKAKKVEPEPETKKQRQRRQKREAEKEQRAEDEAERRRLMEKQLKTARTAEGTAKSGQYRTYVPPASSAWNAGGDAQGETAGAAKPTTQHQLLDTFEPLPTPKAVATEVAADTVAQLDPPSDASRASLESEPRSSGAASMNGGDFTHEPLIASDGGDAWEDYQLRTIREQEKQNDQWQEVAPRKGKKAVK